MCGIDWQYECGPGVNSPTLYETIKALKKDRICWEECGIVEVELTLVKWKVKQTLFEKLKRLK